jgi:single-strand DNA-binding protein|nr:MAG TPA: Single strand binding protein [Caudoviricetes sp.]
MNKVILIGRTTKSPELRYAPGTGTAVCRFTLAVPRAFKKDEADFINCVAFGKIGETIAQYVLKGRQVAVTGSIRTGSYDNNSGNKVYTTDVVLDGFEFIGNNKNSNWEAQIQEDGFEGVQVDDYDGPF